MLYGSRIRLRAPERDDLPTFVRWFNDPEVRHYLRMYAPLSLAQEERWFESLISSSSDFVFVIEVPEEGRWTPIGNTGLHRVDWKNRMAAFGIAIGEKAYWNQGYGTDATQTMLKFAFHELSLHRVELEVYDFNARAIRCYEKVGFRREGIRRQALFRGGAFHDTIWMAILRPEFEETLQKNP
ncbi:MAG: GNAT family protein [Anaerolineae bacterium]